MKENNKQVVFYSAENDGFLMSYKDKGNLAFTATFDGSDFEHTEREETIEDRNGALINLLAN